MTRDPAFLFYPGDYLRDTVAMTPNIQVVYDKIMCLHIQSYDISYEKHMSEHTDKTLLTKNHLKTLTSSLTEDEKNTLLDVLQEKDGGYFIPWVRESILKRKAYVDSRRKNREGKFKINQTLSKKTYDQSYENHMSGHMEIEISRNNILLSDNLILDKQSFTRKNNLDNNNKWLESRILRKDCQEEKEKIFLNVYNEFIEMRNAMGKPVTAYGEKLIMEKLELSTSTIDGKIKILEQSIMNGWSSICPLSNQGDSKNQNLLERETEIIDSLKEIKTSGEKEDLITRARSIIYMTEDLTHAFPGHKMECNLVWLKTVFLPKYIHLKTERLKRMFDYLKINYKPYGGRYPIIADFEEALEATVKPEVYTAKKRNDFVPYTDHEVKAVFEEIKEKFRQNSTPGGE